MENTLDKELEALNEKQNIVMNESDLEFEEKVKLLTELFEGMDPDTQERMLKQGYKKMDGVEKIKGKTQAQKNKIAKARKKEKMAKEQRKKNR